MDAVLGGSVMAGFTPIHGDRPVYTINENQLP
jgi:hypothetical protein